MRWLLPLLVLPAACGKPLVVAEEPPMRPEDLRAEVDPYVRYEPKEIPAAQNGWRFFERWGEMELPLGTPNPITPLTVPDLKSDPKRLAQARRTLAAYRPKLALIEQALARKQWQAPRPKPQELSFSQLAGARDAARALILRANVHLADRAPKKAVQDLLAAREIGERLGKTELGLIGFLVAVACEATGNRAIELAAFHPAMGEPELAALLRAIPPSPTADRPYQNALRSEFEFRMLPEIGRMETPQEQEGSNQGTQIMNVAARILKGHPSPIGRRATVREASKVYAVAIHNGERPWSAQVPTAPLAKELQRGWPRVLVEDWDQVDRVTPEGEAEARKALKSVPNPFGRFYIGPSLAVLDFATQSSFKQRTNREATRLILALRLYALQSKGTLPPSLRTLVERGIIEAVPTDRFSGRAFHYDATRKVFWSVGPNGRDDGGRGRPGGTSTKDADFVWSAAGAL